MATTVTPLPALDRTAPDFRVKTNLFFGTQLPTFTVQINEVSFELMTARNQTVAARDEAVPLANQVIVLAPQAIAASNNVSVLAPQVAQNAQLAETARVNAVAAAAQATQVNMGGSTGFSPFPPTQVNDWSNSRFLRPVFTRTRASVATYIDQMGRLRTAASGEPVFEWDATGRCRGLRVEPARTNVRLNSGALATVFSSVQATNVTAAAVAAPDGSMTAAKLAVDSTTALHSARSGTTVTSVGNTHTVSMWLKAAGRTSVQMVLTDSTTTSANNVSTTVDLAAGTLSAVSQAGTGVSGGAVIQPFADGWYRVSITGNFASGSTLGLWLSLGNNAGDGSSGILLWGMQVEAAASPSSYIPTATAAVTRPADVITLPAAAAAEVLNPAQGAFVVEFTLNSPAAVAVVPFAYKNAAGNEILYADASLSGISVRMTVGGTGAGSSNLLPAGAVAGTRYRLAVAYSSAGFRASLNGGAVAAVTPTVALPLAWDRLDVGLLGSSSQLNGHIASLLTYNRIPSDTELRAMSAAL